MELQNKHREDFRKASRQSQYAWTLEVRGYKKMAFMWYAQAFEAFKKLCDAYEIKTDCEPTRSTIFVSCAATALKSENFAEIGEIARRFRLFNQDVHGEEEMQKIEEIAKKQLRHEKRT